MLRFSHLAAACAAVLLSASPLSAARIYVSPAGGGNGAAKSSPATLKAALALAQRNGQDDVLYLRTGVYNAASPRNGTFSYDATGEGADGKSVTLLGGWNSAFTAQSEDRTLTRLSGGGSVRVLSISADAPGAAVSFAIERLTITDGKTLAPENGAGILAWQGAGAIALTIRQAHLDDNVAENAVGGALAADCPVTIEDSDFLGNTASSGGAIYLWATAAPAVISGALFSDNYTSVTNDPGHPWGWQGCSIFSSSTDLTVSDSEILGRDGGATSGDGSALYVHTGGRVRAVNTIFRGNVIQHWGAAAGLWNASAEFVGCLFEGNRAGGAPSYDGWGAITFLNLSGLAQTIRITNCTFVGNTTPDGTYGAYYLNGNGHAAETGVSVTNSVFWNNGTQALFCQYCTGSIGFSDVEGGAAGTGGLAGLAYAATNISANPGFVPGDSDYHLGDASPCIDAGSNAAPALPPTDFDGDPRVFTSDAPALPLIDMGHDEACNGWLDFTFPEGERWLTGTEHAITWSCGHIGGDVRLYLWKGPRFGGREVREIEDAVPCGQQSFLWTVPSDLPGAPDYAIAMDSALYPTVGHGRGVTVLPYVALSAPNGGQRWRAGRTYTISWRYAGAAGRRVRITLLKDDAPLRAIAARAPIGAAGRGSFRWTIPGTLAAGTTFKIGVGSATAPAATDVSDGVFTILRR